MTSVCIACSHWSPKESPAMARLGFAPCDVRSVSGQPTFSATCPRECPKFAEAPEPVIEARRKFLGEAT